MQENYNKIADISGKGYIMKKKILAVVLGLTLCFGMTGCTADGKELAAYEGKIDIDTNDGGYVKFDFNGKRYIYYNCFVESIADID